MTLYGGWESFGPVNSTTYYIGGDNYNSTMNGSTTFSNEAVIIPASGSITDVFTKIRFATSGGAEMETVNHFIRINDSADCAPGVCDYTSASSGFLGQNLVHTVTPQAVSAGDLIALKIVTPVWITPPLGVRWYTIVYIE